MLPAVTFLTLAGLIAGLALTKIARRMSPSSERLIERIDQVLPQTQCAQCGFPGCRPYAEAIASGAAPINRCPPGGTTTIAALADLLGKDAVPLDAACGAAQPALIAFIDEDICIGCARCLAACPVDAIVGAHQYMHTVLRDECTGCELCLAPCPVDCITLAPAAVAVVAE